MFSRILFVLIFCIGLNGCASKKNVITIHKNTNANYSEKLGCPLPASFNKIFIEAISEWIGVPYQYGGGNKTGTDCSGFVQTIYKSVFNKTIEHNALQISKKSRIIKNKDLQQGDLLFFKINKKQIDHVGMHIYDTYFIHASTKKGVIVSDIKQAYYQETFEFYGKID